MIKITIKKEIEKIDSIIVCGHANYNESGKDIVCAGVSAIIIGGLNALTSKFDKSNFKIETKEGFTSLEILESNDEIQLILQTIIIQLKSIEESYSKFVKIRELEG